MLPENIKKLKDFQKTKRRTIHRYMIIYQNKQNYDQISKSQSELTKYQTIQQKD